MKEKMEFAPVSFSRLWKNEFRVLVNQVVDVVGQTDPETMNIKFVYDELLNAQTQLQLLQVAAGKHPLTTELLEKSKNRKKLVQTLVSQLRILNSANTVYAIPQLGVLSPFVQRYLNPIVYVNSTVQTDYLKEMFSKLDASTTVQSAIEALNLKASFDELRTLQESFVSTRTNRIITRNRLQVRTAEVRAAAEKSLRNLIKEIELAQLKYPELDYSDLITKMNEVFTFYGAQAKTRATIRKNSGLSKVSTRKKATTAQNGNSEAVA